MNSSTEAIQFRRTFIVSVCALELVVLLVNGFSVVFYMNDSNHQKSSATDPTLVALAYTLNVENMLYGVFLLLGFGLVLVYLKECSWSGLTFSLMGASICYQLYPLFNTFWNSVFISSFSGTPIAISPSTTANGAIRCAVAMEVILCGLIAKLNIMQLLLLMTCGVMSFSFCEVINVVVTRTRGGNSLDAGGSMDIFLWAGVFALTVAYSLRSKYHNLKDKYRAIPQNDNPLLALVGTSFLWAGFMFIGHANSNVQKEMDMAPMNTIFALSSSVITTFMLATWVNYRLGIYETVLATISGGVIVGSSSSFLENPGAALVLGAISGTVTYLLIHFTFQRINARWMVMTHEIFATFLINGFLGGAASSIALAGYLNNASTRTLFFGSGPGNNSKATDCSYQIAHLGVTTILSLFCGLLVSSLVRCVSSDNNLFLDDTEYFDEEGSLAESGWAIDQTHQRGGLYRSRADHPI